MSLASKVTLAGSCAGALGIIGYVHYRQHADREKLHQGVIKDIERQRMKKIENIYTLTKQQDLTKQLKAMELQENTTNTNAPL